MKHISANMLNRFWKRGVSPELNKKVNSTKVLSNVEEIEANTDADNIAGALALKEVNNSLSGVSFNPQSDGLYATYKVGADSVTKKLGSGIDAANIVAQLMLHVASTTTFTTNKDYKLLIIVATDAANKNPIITCNGGVNLLNTNSVMGYARATTAIYKDVPTGSIITGKCFENTQSYTINIFSLE